MLTPLLCCLSCAGLASGQQQDPTPIQQRIGAMTQKIRPQDLRTTITDLVAMGTRHTGGPGKEKALAYLEKRVAALAERSKGRLKYGREEQEVLATRLGRKIPIVNLICRLEGTSDPERIYVLGGHFDSINSDVGDAEGAAPGANDDGSGTAAVLEALRVMCDQEFAATIEFCFFDAEEMGLLGSTVHAEALAKKEAYVDGMITNDIVGNTLGMDGKKNDQYLRCFSYAPRGNDSPGRSFARAATWAARAHVPGFELRLVFRGDRFGRGGDHKPFANAGWPALRFTEAAEDFSRQHQTPRERDGKSYGDTIEFVDFEYLARVVAVDVATLAEVASAPRAPTRAQVAGSRTSYETNLTWEGPQRRDAPTGGYEAVWRETTAPDWQHVLPLAARGRAVLPVSVDDHVIGVRSVGADGSRSRATTPAEPDATEQRPTSRPTSREGGRRR